MITFPPLILDFYSGNPDIPYEFLMKIYHVRAFTRKFAMGFGKDWVDFEKDVLRLRAAGGKLLGYQWCDPTAIPAYQSELFLWQMHYCEKLGIPIVGVMLDIEQAWPWLNGKLDKTRVLSAQQILSNAMGVYDYLLQRVAPLPIIIYTGRWFSLSYCGALGTWIANKPSIMAYYPDLYPPIGPKPSPYYPTYEEASIYLNARTKATCPTCTGATNVIAQQSTSRMSLPGVGANYDLSVWFGDDASLNQFFGI